MAGACREQPGPDTAVRESLRFEGLRHEIVLEDAAPVADALALAAPTWTLTRAAGPDSGRRTFIERGTSGYRFHPARGAKPIRGLGPAGGACGIIADAIQAWLDQHPGTLGLHCGAFEIAGRVVALTGPYRTGKSTLISRLGADADTRIFTDDVLPIRPDGRVQGLGVLPRLRLPLPEGASGIFRHHVDAASAVSDARYAYVAPKHLAPHGATGTLGAVVVLTRTDDTPARLHEADRIDAMRQLIRQNIADPGDPLGHIGRMESMVTDVPCYRMIYSDLEEAVTLLRAAFGGERVPGQGVTIHPPVAESGPARPERVAPLDCAYRQDGETGLREVGDDLFLWQPLRRNYFHLNPVARAVWTLLEAPVRGDEIVAVLSQAFPDEHPDTISRDISRLLARLEAQGLVSRAD